MGSRPGERRGGRAAGAPNKATSEGRAKFLKMFERLSPKTEKWIQDTAEGIEVTKTDKDGNEVTMKIPGDPGRAAELVLRMAEFYVPKLARTEITGEDGEKLSVSIQINGVAKGDA